MAFEEVVIEHDRQLQHHERRIGDVETREYAPPSCECGSRFEALEARVSALEPAVEAAVEEAIVAADIAEEAQETAEEAVEAIVETDTDETESDESDEPESPPVAGNNAGEVVEVEDDTKPSRSHALHKKIGSD